MANVVGDLATALSAANLWACVGELTGIIAVSVLFGLGFTLVKRVLNKIKRAKGGI